MERSVSELLRDAQQLSHQDLTDLVHELLHALEVSDSADEATDAEGAEKAWTSQALQRLEEIEDGSVHSVGGPNALESVREQLAAHRRSRFRGVSTPPHTRSSSPPHCIWTTSALAWAISCSTRSSGRSCPSGNLLDRGLRRRLRPEAP